MDSRIRYSDLGPTCFDSSFDREMDPEDMDFTYTGHRLRPRRFRQRDEYRVKAERNRIRRQARREKWSRKETYS